MRLKLQDTRLGFPTIGSVNRMQLLGHLHVTSLLVSSFDRDVTCNLVTKNPSGIDVRHLLTRLSRPQVNNQTNEMNGRDVKKRVQWRFTSHVVDQEQFVYNQEPLELLCNWSTVSLGLLMEALNKRRQRKRFQERDTRETFQNLTS